MKNDFDSIYRSMINNRYFFGTGAWAIENKDIKMQLNERGEFYPQLEKKTIEFSKQEVEQLAAICLSLSDENESTIANKLFSRVPSIKHDDSIGFYLNSYVGYVVEGDFRRNGSSGGFGTWIASELIKRENITGVLHVTEGNSKMDNGLLFRYSVSKNIESVKAGAKTKYYPVEYSKVIKYIKNNPGRYVLVGLPSYIMELRLLASVDPVIKERIVFTVGLVCGHQKSTSFSEFLAWQCNILPGKLHKINFRKKLDGLPSSEYGIEVVGEIDGEEKTVIKKMSDLVGHDWGEGLFKVRASDFTDDVMNETADITLGDAWLPEYVKDSGGNNIIVVRNPIIDDIITKGIENGTIHVDRVNAETIYRSQASHYRHTRDELPYRLYRQEKVGKWHPQKRTVSSGKLSWIRKQIQNERETICLDIPDIYRKAVKKNDINYFIKNVDLFSRKYKWLYKLQRLERIPNKVRRIFK